MLCDMISEFKKLLHVNDSPLQHFHHLYYFILDLDIPPDTYFNYSQNVGRKRKQGLTK
jgi:hypothetical protein